MNRNNNIPITPNSYYYVMNNGQIGSEIHSKPSSSDYPRTTTTIRTSNAGLVDTNNGMVVRNKVPENSQARVLNTASRAKSGSAPNVCPPVSRRALTECCYQKIITHDKEMQTGDCEDDENPDAKLRNALEENIRLRSVIHDVTEVNKRWQKYNQERQGYVQKLLTTIKELQQKELSNTELIARAQETTPLQEKCEQLKSENLALQKDLFNSEQHCRHLSDTLALIQRELNERIGLLEMQVRVQIEDFNTEKTEKEEAIKTAEYYREQNLQLKKQLSDLEKDPKRSRVYVCTCQNHTRQGVFCKIAELQKRQMTSQHHEIQVLPCQVIPRSSSVNDLHSMKSMKEVKLKSTLDISSKNLATTSRDNTVHQRKKEDRWLLMCPKCRKYFPPNLGMQFSFHVDHCDEEEANYRCSQ